MRVFSFWNDIKFLVANKYLGWDWFAGRLRWWSCGGQGEGCGHVIGRVGDGQECGHMRETIMTRSGHV